MHNSPPLSTRSNNITLIRNFVYLCIFSYVVFIAPVSLADLFKKNNNSTFADAVCEAFQKQEEYHGKHVRPQRDRVKKLKAWHESWRLLSSDLGVMSHNGVNDKMLLHLKCNAAWEVNTIERLLRVVTAGNNTPDILEKAERDIPNILAQYERVEQAYINFRDYVIKKNYLPSSCFSP